MYYNINDINEYMSNFNNINHFTDEDVDTFVSIIECQTNAPDFDFATGATKCVIIPNDKDYVIKIPFDGEMNWNGDGEKEFYAYRNGGRGGWNYLDLEVAYYDETVWGSGFEDFFLAPESVNTNVTNWPVYVQKKAICYLEAEAPYCSKDSIETVQTKSKMNLRINLPTDWLATCLENLGGDVEKLDEFITFLKDFFTDLHNGNIGYLDGHAVIFDYAGYYD